MATDNILKRLAARQFTAPVKRREFNKDEQAEVDEAKSKIFPDMISSEGDPISDDMSSPFWSGLGGGAVGALAGAGGGSLIGDQITTPSGGKGTTGGAIVGGGVGGILGYLLASKLRDKKNLDIEEKMRRLPRGATQRDLLGDEFFRSLVSPAAVHAPTKMKW